MSFKVFVLFFVRGISGRKCIYVLGIYAKSPLDAIHPKEIGSWFMIKGLFAIIIPQEGLNKAIIIYPKHSMYCIPTFTIKINQMRINMHSEWTYKIIMRFKASWAKLVQPFDGWALCVSNAMVAKGVSRIAVWNSAFWHVHGTL